MILEEIHINPLFEDAQKDKRLEFIRNAYHDKWQGLLGYDDFNKFLIAVKKVDPTPKGTMMQWIARLAIKNPDLNKPEDFKRLAADLKNFELFKNRLAVKDINQYKSYQELYLAIAPFLKKNRKLTNKEKLVQKNEKLREEIIDVYNGPEGWIKIPITQEASCYLGQNTRWCTSAKNNNMFNSYNKTDKLFIIYNKETQQRTQLHLNSNSFNDESDTSLGFKQIPEWAKKPIVAWYRYYTPSLSLQQLAKLSKMDDVSDMSDEHSDLLKLMREYQ